MNMEFLYFPTQIPKIIPSHFKEINLPMVTKMNKTDLIFFFRYRDHLNGNASNFNCAVLCTKMLMKAENLKLSQL